MKIFIIPEYLFEDTDPAKYKNLFMIDAPNFWYLHGELESQFHFDKAYMLVDEEVKNTSCVEINKRLYINEGIYDVEVECANDQKCVAYMWHSKESEHTLLRGLVVNKADKKYVKDAEKKYKEKPLIM